MVAVLDLQVLAAALAVALLASTIAIAAKRSPPLAIEPLATSPAASVSGPGSAGSQLAPATKRTVTRAYGKLPLSFIPNRGQTDERVRYYAQGRAASFYFTRKNAVLAFEKGRRGAAVRLEFLGANQDVKLESLPRQAGTVNYLRGHDPRKWQASLPTYRGVAYRDLWPGIDMVLKGQRGRLVYEFRVKPGADPSNIRLGNKGADGLSLSPGGDLLIGTSLGTLSDDKPRSFQRIDGRRVAVGSRYALSGDSCEFAVGHYDRRHPTRIGSD
jgi:hypothetical protein